MDCQIFIVQYNSGMSHSTDAYRSPNDKEIFFARVKWKTQTHSRIEQGSFQSAFHILF